ncbi:MAG: alpha/beta fold hydrolase [Planctomycetota bacterium]
MIVDLVRMQTPDSCSLDGALQRPPTNAPSTWPLDAVILIHGTGSNFYQSTLLEALSDMFLANGVATLRVNTRGHDGISTAVTARGGLRLGAAYENVDDCRHDLLGWSKFAATHIGPRVALLGHSLGAVKSVYAAAHERDLAPALVIAVSPPRLSYEGFCRSSRRDEFLNTFRVAEAHVQAGKPQTLMEVAMPLPMVISAAGYVEKYGPDGAIDFVPLVERLRGPALFVFGANEVETNVAFQNLPDELSALRPTRHGRDIAIIPGADHFYAGKRNELARLIHDRIGPLLKPSAPT